MTSLNPIQFKLLIIDDLMHEMNEVVAKLFTKGSHHSNTSVLLLTQNIFHQNKHSRTVRLHAHCDEILTLLHNTLLLNSLS